MATLLTDDAVAAEAAAARLVILGRPSVRNLMLALPDADTAQAVRILHVLERIADPLALPIIADALADARDAVAEAAVNALAVLLTAARSAVAAEALDHMTSAALAPARPPQVRLAALQALVDLDLDVVAPVRAQLLSDPDPVVRAAAERSADGEPTVPTEPQTADETPAGVVCGAANGVLPSEPEALRRALAEAGRDVPLGDLHRVIQRVRAVERQSVEAPAWRTARAAAHQALADRGSRLAVYDLRETLQELGSATPVGMLSALRAVGDAASLDAVADAWASSDDAWVRDQLATTFATIVRREGLTRRHGAIRRLAQRAPQTVDALWPPTQPGRQ